MTDRAALKADLRRDVFARRKTAHAAAATKAPAANERLLTRIGPVRGRRVIAGYRPIRTELDPTPAMTALARDGARICVPVIEAVGRPLAFREWSPGCAMTEGPFGAEVPASGDWLEPEVLIVPLVGWDRSGARLGYGGGFYDRTLERLRAARPSIRPSARSAARLAAAPTVAIGFAFDAQELPAAPQEPTDQPLDALVTETETLEFAR